MILEPVHCLDCDGTDIIKNGKSPEGKQRDCGSNPHGSRHSLILDYTDQADLPQIKQKGVDKTSNDGCGMQLTLNRGKCWLMF